MRWKVICKKSTNVFLQPYTFHSQNNVIRIWILSALPLKNPEFFQLKKGLLITSAFSLFTTLHIIREFLGIRRFDRLQDWKNSILRKPIFLRIRVWRKNKIGSGKVKFPLNYKAREAKLNKKIFDHQTKVQKCQCWKEVGVICLVLTKLRRKYWTKKMKNQSQQNTKNRSGHSHRKNHRGQLNKFILSW